MYGMDEFRTVADDTWVRIITLHTNPNGNSAAPASFASLFKRRKLSNNMTITDI